MPSYSKMDNKLKYAFKIILKARLEKEAIITGLDKKDFI